MKSKIFKFFLLLAGTSLSLFLIFAPFVIKAQTTEESERCKTFAKYFTIPGNGNATSSLVEGLPKYCSMSQILAEAMKILLYLSGTVTILFIILGGFYYLTAAGNDEQLEKGKKILINSVIGLIVIIMATAIVRIISTTLQKSGGSNTTTTTSN